LGAKKQYYSVILSITAVTCTLVGDALQGAPLPFHPARRGGVKVAPLLLY
jgi:hypothetical protein